MSLKDLILAPDELSNWEMDATKVASRLTARSKRALKWLSARRTIPGTPYTRYQEVYSLWRGKDSRFGILREPKLIMSSGNLEWGFRLSKFGEEVQRSASEMDASHD